MVRQNFVPKARPAAAVHPCASSQIACHCSRYRGVGARYIRRLTSLPFMRHRSSSAPISIMPNSNPHSNSVTDQLNYRQFYPTPMRVSPRLRFRKSVLWAGPGEPPYPQGKEATYPGPSTAPVAVHENASLN